MLKLVTGSTAAALLLIVCCAPAPPASGPAAHGPEAADTTAVSSYEDAFLDLYGRIVSRLEEAEPEGEAAVAEARAVLAVAEEMYLEGKIDLALKLLREADEMVRRTP
jgi:hypothetical protein